MNIGTAVKYRATGEVGVVTRDNGDLLDVQFPAGSRIVHRQDLESAPSAPDDLLLAGQLGPAVPYGLRLQALYLRHAYRNDPASGLSNARVEPKPHQVFVAHRVTHKLQPRMILADEVGLGKTIEAGLIIKELRARRLIPRVLIVAPAGLLLQWQQEMRSKFNEEFEIYDGAAVKFLGGGGINPWIRRDNVIASLPFAANSKNAEQIIEAEWDLVVFDEAHRVRRTQQSPRKVNTTLAYRLADDLKDLIDGLLLLTATPMQLQPYELYSLIELVEPGLYPSFGHYERQRKQLPQLNDLMNTLKGWETQSREEKTDAVKRHAGILASLGRTASDVDSLDDPTHRSAIMDRLSDLHPLANVLIRNRKVEIGGFTSREASQLIVDLTQEERNVYQEVTEYIRSEYDLAQQQRNRAVGFLMVTYQKMLASSSQAIRASFMRRIDKLRLSRKELLEKPPKDVSPSRLEQLIDDAERTEELTAGIDAAVVDSVGIDWEIERLEKLAERLGSLEDSKAHQLLDLVEQINRERPGEKILVFTQFKETQSFLAENLKAIGIKTAVFNGSISLEAKEAAVTAFRGDTQVLVSTEAGGEGRNFQFCHVMVNYDLPWNPMKIEQRIGRLDRIGQLQNVFIYNLACRDTIEERVLEVLDQRIGLFVESVGSLDPILGEVEDNIEKLVMRQLERFDEQFAKLGEDIERRVREARAQERSYADFALDRASLRHDIVNELLGRRRMAGADDLERFSGHLLDYYGGHLNEHADGGVVVSLAPRLMPRIKARQSVTRGVFDPESARGREDLDFLAFGHDLVERLVSLPIDFEPVTVAARRLPDESSELAVELVWQLETTGLQPSGKMIRHVVDQSLTVREEELDAVPATGEPVDLARPEWAEQAIHRSKERIALTYGEARERARGAAAAIKEERLARAERIHEYRRIRYQRRIDEQSAWITEKEGSGSERDRRILPARRGRLEKERERLRHLEAEYEEQCRVIHEQEPGTSLELLAAGLVIGR
jgi:SNF2 family DNA or RNA helicase